MKATLHRRDVVESLLSKRKDLLVIAGLGSTAWDITAAGDSPLNFPMWGAMGQAAMIGLGSLATIGVQQPKNFSVVVIDNGRYGETGMQATHTASGVDLSAAALACKFRFSETIFEKSGIEKLRRTIHAQPGPNFAAVKVVAEKLPLVLPPREGALLKARFRRAVLGDSADSA
jgi:hypothetical protein